MFEKVGETLSALPVAAIAADVVKSVKEGNVTILAAPTGSGKSMMVPAMLADAMSAESAAEDNQILVLVPRRLLALDAADNVSKMAEKKLGEEVGYAFAEKLGEKSMKSKGTKLLFATYGYAINSGLINTAKTVVLDEVHESQQDISLARAILHKRKTDNEPGLSILEMSATVNASKQSKYWEDIPGTHTAIHQIDGQTMACEESRIAPVKDETSIPKIALDLLQKGRKGIAIFRAGIKDVDNTVKELQEALKSAGIHDVDVMPCHGSTPSDKRREARLAPAEGRRKIIVGTNTIESGVNLRWVDAGISDGFGNIPYDRHDMGAGALVREDLAQWRLIQQRGRINRAPEVTGHESGAFILYSHTEMNRRQIAATPELENVSLLHIAFRAACCGYNPEDLKFDTKIETARIQEAKEDLIRLGLIADDWRLTDDGEYASRLPLSPETAAMVCEAHRMDIETRRQRTGRQRVLNDSFIIAAITQERGLRENRNRSHGLEGGSDVDGASDIMDGFKAYLKLEGTPSATMVAGSAQIIKDGDEDTLEMLDSARERLKADCLRLNVDYTAFCNVMELVGELRARTIKRDKNALKPNENADFTKERYNDLKQVILNGNAHKLFALHQDDEGKPAYRDLLRDFGNRRNNLGGLFSYKVEESSTLHGSQESSFTPLVVGALRELPPKRDSESLDPVIELTQVTSIPASVFINWALTHQPPVLENVRLEKGKGKSGILHARYSGRAEFEMPIPEVTKLIEQQVSQLEQPENAQGWAAAQISGGSGGNSSRRR